MNAILAYFRAGWVSPNQYNKFFRDRIRPLCRWWMEFIRNLIVLVGVYWVALRSENPDLIFLSKITVMVLMVFILTYMNTWQFNFFSYVRSPGRKWLLNGLLWGACTACAALLMYHYFWLFFEGLVRVNLPR